MIITYMNGERCIGGLDSYDMTQIRAALKRRIAQARTNGEDIEIKVYDMECEGYLGKWTPSGGWQETRKGCMADAAARYNAAMTAHDMQ